MARRRYKSEAISAAGHGEQPRDPAPDEGFERPIQPAQEYGKAEPEPTSHPQAAPEPTPYVSNLGQQINDMRQRAQSDQLDAYLDYAFPGAMVHERQWLRANVHHLQNPALVHQAASIALQRGVPRQSPEFLHCVGALLDQHHAAMQAQPAPPPPPPPPMPAHTHLDSEQSDHDSEPEAEPMPSHYSAPVSREAGASHSIDPQLSASQVRLSPEERELCALNKIDEVKYAEGKLRLAKQKAAKVRD